MIVRPEIVTTGDGSHTLYVRELDEHYHSLFGAITESRHVFIRAGLQAAGGKRIHVFEMGFGTGLNALLTLEEARRSGRKVHYTGFEKHPLGNDILVSLNYHTFLPEAYGRYFHLLHQAPWNQASVIDDTFTLEKMEADVRELEILDRFGLVYFDAFAPDKQPELWSSDVFSRIFRSMKPGSVLTTYSSKGQVRRNLAKAGFRIEKLPGPPGKRDMTRAWKD